MWWQGFEVYASNLFHYLKTQRAATIFPVRETANIPVSRTSSLPTIAGAAAFYRLAAAPFRVAKPKAGNEVSRREAKGKPVRVFYTTGYV